MIKKLCSKVQFNKQLMTIASIVIAAVFIVVYIATVNGVATAGFEVSKIEKEIASLKRERADLQLQVSAIGSLQRVETQSRSLSLIPVTEIEYLNSLSSVAVR